MIRDWPVISREQIGDFRLFSLTKKKVRSPRTGEIREVQTLQFPDWVLILALTPQEEVVMVRQYRHGTEACGFDQQMPFLSGSKYFPSSKPKPGCGWGYRNFENSLERDSAENQKRGNRSWHGAVGLLFFLDETGVDRIEKYATCYAWTGAIDFIA